MKEKKLNIFYTADFFSTRNNENAAPLWSGGEASAPFKRSAGAPSVSEPRNKASTRRKVLGGSKKNWRKKLKKKNEIPIIKKNKSKWRNPMAEETVEQNSADNAIIAHKENLVSVMQEENALLDKILEQQTLLHNCVREKDWEKLNSNIENLQNLSDRFVELEEKRMALSENIDMAGDEMISPVLTEVRGKLQKSKVENKVLNEYITTTRKFLQGVFDSVVPQRRNVLYSNKGQIVKPELSSVVLNQMI